MNPDQPERLRYRDGGETRRASASMSKEVAVQPDRTWKRRLSSAVRIGWDLCVLGAGICVLIQAPPSLKESPLPDWVTTFWALSLVLGAILSTTGILARSAAVEAAGCTTFGMGFVLWTVTAATRPGADLTSYAIALVIAAGVFGQVYRAIMADSPDPRRRRERV